MNPTLTDETNTVLNKILGRTQSKYYIGVLEYTCALHYEKISNTNNIWNYGFKSISSHLDAIPVLLYELNNTTELKILNNQYPKCIMNHTSKELKIQTLITTFGGDKTPKASTYNVFPEDTKALLMHSLKESETEAKKEFKDIVERNKNCGTE